MLGNVDRKREIDSAEKMNRDKTAAAAASFFGCAHTYVPACGGVGMRFPCPDVNGTQRHIKSRLDLRTHPA